MLRKGQGQRRQPFASTSYVFTGPGDGIVDITVTRIPDLTLDSYLDINWFGDPVPTTVNARPAMVNAIDADGAGGLVWSPVDGVVIELHTATKDAGELRTIVENMGMRARP